MNSLSRIGLLMVVTVLGCGSSATQAEGTATDGVGTSDAASGTTGPNCSMQPTVVVWLALNTGGLVSAEVEYSIAGGPRVAAEGCTQGACFIYEGAGQPIEVFARYEDCDESTLSITGAVCPEQGSAELAFGFYDGCTPPYGTDGPPGSGSDGSDSDTDSTGTDSTGTDSTGTDGTGTTRTSDGTSTGGTSSR
ncbi:MAG: hypothetical protein KUG77_21440 [Nannocystaceae bacterium]|nr:hypothetical protein [Nannocystaceae bacterium]